MPAVTNDTGWLRPEITSSAFSPGTVTTYVRPEITIQFVLLAACRMLTDQGDIPLLTENSQPLLFLLL